MIIFSPGLKKIAYRLLTSQSVIRSAPYNLLYNRWIKKTMARHVLVPYQLNIENTNICNADCAFCPHHEMKRKQGSMNFNLFERIIDQAAEYDIPVINIHGFGEPLLDKDFFRRVEYTRRKTNGIISTNTNASFIDEDNIVHLLECGLDKLYISFDAATADTYRKIRPKLDFDEVESNIKKLIRARRERRLKSPKIYLSFVKCPANARELEMYLKKWRPLVDGISVSFLHNWAGKYSGAHLLKDSSRRDPCRILWTDMWITWTGEVIICCYDYEGEYMVGDLKMESITEIWQGEKLKELRRLHIRREYDRIGICKDCVANLHSRNPWWSARR